MKINNLDRYNVEDLSVADSQANITLEKLSNSKLEEISLDEASNVIGGYTASIIERAALINSSAMIDGNVVIQPTESEPALDNNVVLQPESDRLRQCLILGFC